MIERSTHLRGARPGRTRSPPGWPTPTKLATSRDGDRILLQPGFWYRFGRHFRVEASFAGERMEVGTGWLYRAQVAQVTAAWQFDPQAFVRAIVQRVDSRFDHERAAVQGRRDNERLLTQLLFSYKVNSQTVVFLGYSDTADGSKTYPLAKLNRTIFAKVRHALVIYVPCPFSPSRCASASDIKTRRSSSCPLWPLSALPCRC